ncbi:MAG: serine protease [Desulfuromonadales bacterium]|nr:MAG: serine protease [Desulfuromonadales bacterium]
MMAVWGKRMGRFVLGTVLVLAILLFLAACSLGRGAGERRDPSYDSYLKLTREQARKDPLIGIWQGSQLGNEILLAVVLNDEGGQEKLKGVILNGSEFEFGYLREDSWFYVSPMAAQGTYAGKVVDKLLFWPRWFPTRLVMNSVNQFTTYDDIPPNIRQGRSSTHTYIRREAQTVIMDDVMRSSGSGFLIWQSDKVLTAHHVIKDATRITVRFPDGKHFGADVVSRDPANDLALLALRGFSPSDARGLRVLGGTDVAPGEEIHVLGYPLGGILGSQPSIVSGQVSASVGLRNAENQFRITAPINAGNSGGPILNGRGEVVGIAVSVVRQQQIEGVGFGMKIGSSFSMLGDLLQKGSVKIRQELKADEIFRLYSRDVVFIGVE